MGKLYSQDLFIIQLTPLKMASSSMKVCLRHWQSLDARRDKVLTVSLEMTSSLKGLFIIHQGLLHM